MVRRTSKTVKKHSKKISKHSSRKVNKRMSKRRSLSGGAKKTRRSSKHKTSKRKTSKRKTRVHKGGNPFPPPPIVAEQPTSPLLKAQSDVMKSTTASALNTAITTNMAVLKTACPSINYATIMLDITNINDLYNHKSSDQINKTLIAKALNAESSAAKTEASKANIPYIPNVIGIRYRLSSILQGLV